MTTMVEGRVSRVLAFTAVATVFSAGVVYYWSYCRKAKFDPRSKFAKASCKIDKPQSRFGLVLADNSPAPFVHRRNDETEGIDGKNVHPYANRIRALLAEHPPEFLLEEHAGYPVGLDGPYEWVDSRERLEALAEVLGTVSEFAVDTEQHSYHSFNGFTALIQISTRQTDYLVDTISLHDEMSILQDIFSNPAVCKIIKMAFFSLMCAVRAMADISKTVQHFGIVRSSHNKQQKHLNLRSHLRLIWAPVFHGADSDILWLQRDFHIYVVNMFDTAKLADWRVRPLTEEMVQYARTDAHYLLYIAQQLSLEMLEQSGYSKPEFSSAKSLLDQAWSRSNQASLQLYEKEGNLDSSFAAHALVSRLRFIYGNLPPSQLDQNLEILIGKLSEWRDRVARVEDESLRSVLSDAALFALASDCPQTPDTIRATVAEADLSLQAADILGPFVLPPSSSSSPELESHMNELCSILQRFKASNPSYHASAQADLRGEGNERSYVAVLVDKIRSAFSRSAGQLEVQHNASRDELILKTGTSLWERNIPKNWRRGNADRSRMQFVKKFSCKAPVYHNCRIYADDGRLLCFCDRKKIEWYVGRGLAEYMQDDPPAIKLLFEPKGRPEDESNEFYIQSKSNQCVGCGESSHYLRYRIIPSCYRQHFPEYLKSHRSHDIVLLCVDCHEVAHKAAEQHKRKIAGDFGIPLFARVLDGEENEAGFADADGEKGVSPLQLKNAALALLRHGATIPSHRRESLEEVIKAYYGRESINEHDVKAALLVSVGPRERRRLSRRVGTQEAVWSEHVSRSKGSLVSSSRNDLQEGSEARNAETNGATTVRAHEDGLVSGTVEVPTSANLVYGDRLVAESLSEHRYKGRKNDSLLGHSVHGRRVVSMILQQDGDDGIRAFCQQWRAVFVDALQPTFLPPGWEISHSGKREFGDYSVYKPPINSVD